MESSWVENRRPERFKSTRHQHLEVALRKNGRAWPLRWEESQPNVVPLEPRKKSSTQSECVSKASKGPEAAEGENIG